LARPLHPDTVLRRVPDVRVWLTSASTTLVEVATGTLDCGEVGVHVLERFSKATSLREIAEEPATTAREWIDRLDVVLTLAWHGILLDVADGEPHRAAAQHEFDNPSAHINMLDDVTRTERFIAAIGAIVRPGEVVVDIGTGTGVLAMAAARAGADHVYAIEAGAIAEHAEQVIAANGYADRITVLRGWSTTVSLPCRADLLITETIGSEPLDERILEIVTDARRRMLKPTARVIPARLRIAGAAVEVPEEAVASHVYTESAVGRWRERYGFDFGLLLSGERRLRGHRVRSVVARGWTLLAPPQVLADLELATLERATVDAQTTVPAERSGRLDGALLHFEAELAPGIEISSDPRHASDNTSWRNVLTLQPPVNVAAGDRLRFYYRWRASAGPPGLSVAVDR
jgi:precorrin-6B methylase 2